MFGSRPKGSTALALIALGLAITTGVMHLRRANRLFLTSSSALAATPFDLYLEVACPLTLAISRFLLTHSRAFFRTTVSLAGSKLSRNSSFVNVVVGTSIEKVGCICWKNFRPLLSFLGLTWVWPVLLSKDKVENPKPSGSDAILNNRRSPTAKPVQNERGRASRSP